MRCYRNTGFEHGREVGWLLARETEVGVPQAIERGQRARAAVVPGGGEALSETLEALACHVRHQGIAVAEMAIGRRRADAGLPGCLGEGEAGGTLLRNEVEGGADQRLTQVAVMIAAPPAAAVSGPAHAPGLAHSGPGDINPRQACAAVGEWRSRLRARSGRAPWRSTTRVGRRPCRGQLPSVTANRCRRRPGQRTSPGTRTTVCAAAAS